MAARFEKSVARAASLERDPTVRLGVLKVAAAIGTRARRYVRDATPSKLMPRPEPVIVVEPTATGARIANTDYGAWIYEYGAKQIPPVAPMRRAAAGEGLNIVGD